MRKALHKILAGSNAFKLDLKPGDSIWFVKKAESRRLCPTCGEFCWIPRWSAKRGYIHHTEVTFLKSKRPTVFIYVSNDPKLKDWDKMIGEDRVFGTREEAREYASSRTKREQNKFSKVLRYQKVARKFTE